MATFEAGTFEVIVVGAGHAGIEAALAAARMGCRTACFSINMDAVGNMPCNPSIGGTGKGQLVREIDALGGEMARAADACCIQFRMLNRSKGPAVHSLRAQADRRRYQEYMKRTLERQPGLYLMQGEVTEVLTQNGAVCGVQTRTGAVYRTPAVVICTGTFLGGCVILGETAYESGPDGMHAAVRLTEGLKALGLRILRFKTGTPPRVNRRSIDFSRMQPQYGEEDVVPFSFSTEHPRDNAAMCYLTYTNPRTHEILRGNLHRSPLFSGMIKGVGARYCPSIEDKVVRFSDKDRHQLFIEPMGLGTDEMYLQGLSSSMPEEIQMQVLHSIAGLEQAEVMRPAYAIEYDCVDSTELTPALECKKIIGLFGAGQFNGTSGYEEAAAQGLVAGINAVNRVRGGRPLILTRGQAYIGTLIDDIVTKGTNEPYRMMTARSEYRLVLRQDNADKRLMEIGRRIGLVGDETYEKMLRKYRSIEEETRRIRGVAVKPDGKTNALLQEKGSAALKTGMPLSELLRRPELDYDALQTLDAERPKLPREVTEQVEIELKYEGYIRREQTKIDEMARLENLRLPEDADYASVGALRLEARQKLAALRPLSLGQAMRISGVSPADIAALMVWLSQRKRGGADA